MKKELSTGFDTRQHMLDVDFEIFYYNDINPSHVSSHLHDHYELYFFLEGEVDYEIDRTLFHLKYGDFLMIPPGVLHGPVFRNKEVVYRRFVLWLSHKYYHQLCQINADFSYGFDEIKKERYYHFRSDFLQIQQVQGALLELVEESRSNRPFGVLGARLLSASFLLQINRMVYNQFNKRPVSYSNALYLNVCDYINNHLEEDLSLEHLASFFYVSKYHISHIFKEHMGLSLHQYIIKKRLQACKNGILSGAALTSLYQQYGFHDYSSFYRAFKKEFGQSPSEFREQHILKAQTPYTLL